MGGKGRRGGGMDLAHPTILVWWCPLWPRVLQNINPAPCNTLQKTSGFMVSNWIVIDHDNSVTEHENKEGRVADTNCCGRFNAARKHKHKSIQGRDFLCTCVAVRQLANRARAIMRNDLDRTA